MATFLPTASAQKESASNPVTSAAPILGLHHFAYRCRDAEETREFYEDLLGLRLFHYIAADTVPSTGEFCPYVHVFFQMADGSCLAFFDLGDGQCATPSDNTPAWVNHIALRVASVSDLEIMKARLQSHGVDVLGVIDHRIFRSIYFFDPNGIRVELCAQVASADQMEQERTGIRDRLRAWTEKKATRQSDPH